ncbi:MAG: ATP phosphoribosyltransferase [Patescibacteria group bacterium]
MSKKITEQKLILGLPAGSLKEATVDLFKKAGFRITIEERSYTPYIDDPGIECMLMRAQEIPAYVENGVLDAGITGKDWIEERGAKVVEACELAYSKKGFNPVRLCLAVSNDSKIKNVSDLKGKRIATEFVGLTKRYLRENRVNAKVEFSWGATESKPPKLTDAIVELVDSGKSIQANNLKVIDTIMESTTRLVANEKSWRNKWKQEKIKNIAMLLKGALAAENMVGLKMNLRRKNLRKTLVLLPALNRPTLANLSDRGWLSLEIILAEQTVKELIPALKRIGAEKIIEYPLNKIIY